MKRQACAAHAWTYGHDSEDSPFTPGTRFLDEIANCMQYEGMWSLVTCADPDGTSFVAVADGGAAVRRPQWLATYSDVRALAEDWAEALPRLRDLDAGAGDLVVDPVVLPPVPRPSKLLCAGANYRTHIAEMLGDIEYPQGLEPYYFLLPAQSIVGPDADVVIPGDPAARVDWEAELAVVVARPAKDIPVARALDHVAGYTIVNDVTARGYHARSDPLAVPFTYDWLRAKGRDTFSPMGPGVVPAWLVPDPQNLAVRLWRNGVLEQDGHTSDMIFSVAELVSAASAMTTLEPGDVIATGTPAGVGAGKGTSLVPGDVMTIEIEGVGRLTNTVRQRDDAPQVRERIGVHDQAR